MPKLSSTLVHFLWECNVDTNLNIAELLIASGNNADWKNLAMWLVESILGQNSITSVFASYTCCKKTITFYGNFCLRSSQAKIKTQNLK